ncbi:S9 family peptidase [Zavarzinella formosa]|uniref:S9 family peptidase n=1 Tax=Zavarzinella formosa TaxID=360055 RepID=UPI000317DF37|nr:S9 family peptidase [Zavarzinella formosa]
MKQFSLLTGLLLMTTFPAIADDRRAMTIDDMFRFKRVADAQISPDGNLVACQIGEVSFESNKTATSLWLIPTDRTKAASRLTNAGKSDRHPRWSPDGKSLLFESNRSGSNQLWVIAINGGEARQLTTISTGASNGLWSPDGTMIAFVSSVFPEFSTLPFAESDAKNKAKIDEAEKSPVKAKVFSRLFYRHWDEYIEDKRQHIFVCKADGTDVRDVTPGNRDANPTSSTFSAGDDHTFTPDGKHIVFTAVPAKDEAWSTNYDICRVTLDNKSIDWPSLTKDNPAADNSPRFSADGKKIAYRSQKKAGYEADKWDILVVDCSPDGAFSGKPKNLSEKIDISISEFGWTGPETLHAFVDELGSVATYTFSTDGKSSHYPNGIGNLTSLHSLGSSGSFVCMRSSYVHPNEIMIGGKESEPGVLNLKRFYGANDELLAKLNVNKPESVSIEVEGGIKMQMWILKPPGFDPAKKWPVAFLVHGGPQSAWEDGWSNRWNPSLWAAQGYVVALPNPRGSTGNGQKFVDDISGDWGGKCYRDLMKATDYVEKLPYVDKDRIGAAGASFGGYMMDWFAVNTGRFKCLISHCSVWNFESMWGTTDELWFDEFEHGGLPWEVPGKYAEFSPHKLAGNLKKFKTPMLVVHNDLDFRCPIGQGHELFSALQRMGVPSRFVNFPDEGHWVLKPKNSEFWHREVFAWLTKYVPPGGK